MRRNGGNVTDTDDDDHRIMRDGERLVVSMHLMDSIQNGDKRMTTVSYTLTDGTEQSVTTNDAAAARAIQELLKQNEGLRGQLAAMDALRREPAQVGDAETRDATRLRARDALLAQQATKHNETPHGQYATGLRDAWKSGQAWR